MPVGTRLRHFHVDFCTVWSDHGVASHICRSLHSPFAHPRHSSLCFMIGLTIGDVAVGSVLGCHGVLTRQRVTNLRHTNFNPSGTSNLIFILFPSYIKQSFLDKCGCFCPSRPPLCRHHPARTKLNFQLDRMIFQFGMAQSASNEMSEDAHETQHQHKKLRILSSPLIRRPNKRNEDVRHAQTWHSIDDSRNSSDDEDRQFHGDDLPQFKRVSGNL